jgi:hypothetical protein
MKEDKRKERSKQIHVGMDTNIYFKNYMYILIHIKITRKLYLT